MARLMEPTEEQLTGYQAWVASRPPNVRAVAERFEPWSLYLHKPTGQRVTVVSFGEQEDGRVTLTMSVSADFNLVMFERQVFGVNPDDLEPCELPSETEATGAILSPEQVDEHIDALRVMVRPDLWTTDPQTGQAVRKQ
jgi:hypothetical protein